MSHLFVNPSVVLAASSDGYLAYDVDSNRLHRLNPTAALIVELCDGTRSRKQILDTVEPLLEANGAAPCAGLAGPSRGPRSAPGQRPGFDEGALDSADLHKLATQLRYEDRVLAAFICQQRATELAPKDPQQWYTLAELAHIVGRRDEAGAAYERYYQAHPEDVEVQHLLIALRDEPPPQRASDQYIEQLYSYFASFYDDNMCGDLDYRAGLAECGLTNGLGRSRRVERARTWLRHGVVWPVGPALGSASGGH